MSKWTPYQHGVDLGALHAITHPNETPQEVRKAAKLELAQHHYVHAGATSFVRGYITGNTRCKNRMKARSLA